MNPDWFRRRYATALTLLLFGAVVVKSAWLSDDAFITLRTIANWRAGHGLVWNVGERVQSYTHPLWMLFLAAAHGITGEFYYTVLLLSMGLALLALWILLRWVALTTNQILLVGTAAILSKAFIDYATSGLENPLTYVLLATFFALYFRLFDRGDDSRDRADFSRLSALGLVAALGVVNRHDTALLFAPAMLMAVWEARGLGWRLLPALALGALPLLFWEAFSLFYYGFPFPNTAYAKLNTLIPTQELWAQGGFYLLAALSSDPITPLLLLVGFVLPFATRDRQRVPVAVGIGLYVLYIVSIGGDFMLGRFLAAPFVCALVVVARQPMVNWRALEFGLVWGLLVLVGLWNPRQSPVLSNAEYNIGAVDNRGIADERGHYYQRYGLLTANRNNRWVEQGLIRGTPEPLNYEHCGIGLRGFTASPYTRITDFCGLADALIARLPARYDPEWRIGHPIRHVPEGYAGTVRTGRNSLTDPDLATFYDHLHLVIAGPLWDRTRLRTIFDFNLGRFDGLIDQDKYRFPDRIEVEPGAMGDARSEMPLVHTFNHDGITVDLPEPSFADLLELDLDLDAFDVTLLRDGESLGEARVRHAPIALGDEKYTVVALPDRAQTEGFDTIIVTPKRAGDFRLSRVQPVDTARLDEADLPLSALARLYIFLYYRGDEQARSALPSLLAAMTGSTPQAWRELPPDVPATLLAMPQPALHAAIQQAGVVQPLLDDQGQELLHYVGFSATPLEPVSGMSGVQLQLVFDVRAPFTDDYTVWFHIAGTTTDDEYMIYDYAPMLPTTEWPIGDLFRFEPVLKLPPGEYEASFGFWTPQTRRRLAVAGQEEVYWFNLGTVTVPDWSEGSTSE